MNRASALTALLLLGLGLMLQPLAVADNADPLPGIHTLRADDALLQLAANADFSWIVQLVEWREIEPVRGDRFWEYTDWFVRAAEFYGLEPVLRLDHPPEWAMAPGETPPVDVDAYTAFVGQVATRYRGRVMAYLIWNEPNLAIEWAGQPPDPLGYVHLLCAAQAAVHAADPNALVVSAGLAPTNHNDAAALDDRLFLQAMYAAGAGACFDVLGAHPYGFAYPHDDAYGAHDGLNYARLADLRAIMVEEGDGHKPVWATELGWTTEAVEADQQWLRVNVQEQEHYLTGAFQKAAQEWPWLERIAVWNLSLGLADTDERRGYSLLAEDGTPKPALASLAARNKAKKGQTTEAPSPSALERIPVEVLAPDVVVRLSDVDTAYPHWARPHCGAAPCRSWRGQFYITEPGTRPWTLQMEIMQVEEPGNRVWINGHLLDPPAIPMRGLPDYASVWTASQMTVPPLLLQPGVNTIEIRSAPRLPVYQDDHALCESLQIRHVRLTTGF